MKKNAKSKPENLVPLIFILIIFQGFLKILIQHSTILFIKFLFIPIKAGSQTIFLICDAKSEIF